MSRGAWGGVAALVVSLVLVGGIRSAIPDLLPTEYLVRADSGGVVKSDAATVELSELSSATTVLSANEYEEDKFTAAPDAVLVLARCTLVAHGDTFTTRTQIRTSDGFTYEALMIPGFPQPGPVYVGQSLTTTFVYEIPLDKLSGVIGIHGFRGDGLQPVSPLMVFDLPSDLVNPAVEAVVPVNVLEPVR